MVKNLEKYQSIFDLRSQELLVLWLFMWLGDNPCGCTDPLLAPEPPLAVQDDSFHVSDTIILARLPVRLSYPENYWARIAIGNSRVDIVFTFVITNLCYNSHTVQHTTVSRKQQNASYGQISNGSKRTRISCCRSSLWRCKRFMEPLLLIRTIWR